MVYEKTVGDYVFSNDKSKLQVEIIHSYLSKESYWAQNIPLSVLEQTIKGSVCFGVYISGEQIGYARVISDEATVGYLADVFILSGYRGRGLSKELMSFIMSYGPFKNLRRFLLATRDAHSLYAQFGFRPLSDPESFMETTTFETYPV